MRAKGPMLLTVLLPALAAASAGCIHRSASFPYTREHVWQAALAEAMVWRPNRIDETRFVISSTKADLAGGEVAYELKLTRDPNPFARRPSTRAWVRMVQTRPVRRRFAQAEIDVLRKLRANSDALAGRLP